MPLDVNLVRSLTKGLGLFGDLDFRVLQFK